MDHNAHCPQNLRPRWYGVTYVIFYVFLGSKAVIAPIGLVIEMQWSSGSSSEDGNLFGTCHFFA